MQKEFLPTKERLEDLRSEGHFAYFFSTSRFLLLSLICMVLYFLKKDITSYQNIVKSFFEGNIIISIKDILSFFLIIPLCVLPFVILVILFHSKFLFLFKNVFKVEFRQTYKKCRFINRIFKSFLNFIFSILYFFIVYMLTLEVYSLLNNDYKDILSLASKYLIDNVFLYTSIIFALLGALSFVCSKFLFLYSNKMTREEIEAEAQDG